MYHPGTSVSHLTLSSRTRGLLCLLSILVLGVMGMLDYVSGPEAPFTLFYLAPIATVAWCAGRTAGFAMGAAAGAANLLTSLADQALLPAALWDTGVKIGVYSLLCILIDHVKHPRSGAAAIRSVYRVCVVTATVACVVGSLGFVAQRRILAQRQQALQSSRAASRAAAVPGNDASPYLSQLAARVEITRRASRPVLLGSRDPAGPSCVSIIRSGELQNAVPPNPGDWNGGPATTMAMLYYFDRQNCKTPSDDFAWHQGRLRKFLENQAEVNTKAGELAADLAERARRFRQMVGTWTEFPAGLEPRGASSGDDWLSYCLYRLDTAIANRDLDGTRRWAAELAAATFAVEDLHRWLDFIVGNHLAALDFQRQCESVFVSATSMLNAYDQQSTVSQFPGGLLSLNGIGNYYEIERQAERLFIIPADRLQAVEQNHPVSNESIWVMPAIRPLFIELGQALSPANRKTWERAARTPFERTFLCNMLNRALRVEAASQLKLVLAEFDRTHPDASMDQLMDVLMHRGHSFAGLEWPDRFRPELMQAAQTLSGSDEAAFRQAQQWTYDFCSNQTEYGVTLTLRDALAQRRLDCVRATDMIGAVYRNAGRPSFGHVRWCAETGGHAVAAYLGSAEGKPRTLLADGMAPPAPPEVWPDAYFQGHEWPAQFSSRPHPYAVELYVRGLDSYVWAEGYIVRGPNAGTLTQAPVPYLPGRSQASTTKVYAGPYPQ